MLSQTAGAFYCYSVDMMVFGEFSIGPVVTAGKNEYVCAVGTDDYTMFKASGETPQAARQNAVDELEAWCNNALVDIQRHKYQNDIVY